MLFVEAGVEESKRKDWGFESWIIDFARWGGEVEAIGGGWRAKGDWIETVCQWTYETEGVNHQEITRKEWTTTLKRHQNIRDETWKRMDVRRAEKV